MKASYLIQCIITEKQSNLFEIHKASEHGQEILQSLTADQHMAREEETQNNNSHKTAGRKLK